MKLSHYISSLIGVFFFSIIEVGLSLAIYHVWKHCSFRLQPFYKGLVCSALCLVLIVLTGFILLSNDSKPSTVDIAPLEELSDSDIANISQKIGNLKHLTFKRYVEEIILSNEEHSIKEIVSMYYSTHKNDNRIESAVEIVIYRFESNKWARVELLSNMKTMRQKYRLINLSNGIEIVKGNSWLERNADTYYSASDRRLIYTYFVINEYHFRLKESSYSAESRGNATSVCIRVICETLKDGCRFSFL